MRPKTLAEVAQLTMNGDSFDRCLANFSMSSTLRPIRRRSRIRQPCWPQVSVNPDACRMPTLPQLPKSWPAPMDFPPRPGLRLTCASYVNPGSPRRWPRYGRFCFLESPAAFRSRNLFVSEMR